MNVSLVVDNFLSCKDNFEKSWRGERLVTIDSKVIAKELQVSDPDRLCAAIYGQLPALDQYRDFAQPKSSIFFHRFILHKDLNKRVVWLNDDFIEEQNASASWLLARCRHYKLNKALLLKTLQIIKELAKYTQNGLDLLDSFNLNIKINGLSDWLALVCPSDHCGSQWTFVLIYLSILLQEHDWIQKKLCDFVKSYIYGLIERYEASPEKMKTFTRQKYSEEISRYINLLEEFEMMDSPRSLLCRTWKSWSLQYKGFKLSTVLTPSGFELSYRMARGKPVDYMSLIKENNKSELLKSTYLIGALKRFLRVKRNDRPYGPGESIRVLTQLLLNNSNLTEYEAVLLARGNQPIYKDDSGNFFRLPREQLEFFIALRRLGLQPYRIPLNQKKIAGQAFRTTLIGLNIIKEPHGILFFGAGMKKSQSNRNIEKLIHWRKDKLPLLTIWESLHLKSEKITPTTISKVIQKLANKNVGLAIEIWNHINR